MRSVLAAPSSSCCQAADDLVEPVADLLVAARRDHVGEAAAGRHLDQRIAPAGVVVGDLFDEQQDLHVVLVLAGVHAAAQFVTGLPQGGVELGFLQEHRAGERGGGVVRGGAWSVGRSLLGTRRWVTCRSRALSPSDRSQ